MVDLWVRFGAAEQAPAEGEYPMSAAAESGPPVEPTISTVTTGLGDIECAVQGDGPPVLVVHGSPGRSRRRPCDGLGFLVAEVSGRPCRTAWVPAPC